jgi:hypothetical protein
VAAWLLLLLAPVTDDGYTYPPERRGDLVATLTVIVPEGIGPPRVYYALTVEGTAELDVDSPQLSDAVAGWSVSRASAWTLTGDRVSWTEEIVLDQVKPGIVPLPDVKLLFRDRPSEAWQEAEWTNILKDTRELPGPSPPAAPTPAAQFPRWTIPACTAAIVLLAVVVMLVRRRGVEAPLPPDRRALRELERLEQSAGTTGHESEGPFEQLSDIVRRYLTERFGLPAFQQTTAEFLRTASAEESLAAERDCLREILEDCDLAKFAGVRGDRDQWHRLATLSRAFIQRTAAISRAPVTPATQAVPNGRPREPGTDSSSGTN